MGRSLGDVDRFPRSKWYLIVSARGRPASGHDEPMLSPTTVALQAETGTGKHLDLFDLVSGGILQHLEVPPRSPVPFALQSGLLAGRQRAR